MSYIQLAFVEQTSNELSGNVFEYRGQYYPVDDRTAWPAAVLSVNPDPQTEFIKVWDGDYLSFWDKEGYKVAYAFKHWSEGRVYIGVLGTDRQAAHFSNYGRHGVTLPEAEAFLIWALVHNRPYIEWERRDRSYNGHFDRE